MSTWFQNIPISSGDANALLNLVPANSYRVVAPDSVPTLAADLLMKCDSVLLMRSGCLNDEYVVANLYRRDKGKIDQMPFGSSYISGSASAGLLTHHGDWDERTVSGSEIPPDYYRLSPQSSSAYRQAFATLAMPSEESGSIFDLAPQSNISAFERVVYELKQNRK